MFSCTYVTLNNCLVEPFHLALYARLCLKLTVPRALARPLGRGRRIIKLRASSLSEDRLHRSISCPLYKRQTTSGRSGMSYNLSTLYTNFARPDKLHILAFFGQFGSGGDTTWVFRPSCLPPSLRLVNSFRPATERAREGGSKEMDNPPQIR